MKKRESKDSKINFLSKFRGVGWAIKTIIIGGVLLLVAASIAVPIILIDKKDAVEITNEDEQQQDKDQFVEWDRAYKHLHNISYKNALKFKNVWYANFEKSPHNFINNEVNTTSNSRPGNQAFSITSNVHNIGLNDISKLGINKEDVLKNENEDKIASPFVRFLGFGFGDKKTFANVFYQLKNKESVDDPFYYEKIEIIGFGAPKVAASDATKIANKEFKNMILPSSFNITNDLSIIGEEAFYGAIFPENSNFSLKDTQVTKISSKAFNGTSLPKNFTLNSNTDSLLSNAFRYAKFKKEAKFSLHDIKIKLFKSASLWGAELPNNFQLHPETNLLPKQVMSYVKFEKEAKFSFAQIEIKTIPHRFFEGAILPDGFALNDKITSIASQSFLLAQLNPGFKIPNTLTNIEKNSFENAILPAGYAWYDKDSNKQTITATNYPKAGWYVGKI